MKKTLSILLAAIMVLSCALAFAGCNKDKPDADTTKASENAISEKAEDKNTDADSDFEYVKAKGKIVIGATFYEPIYYMEDGKETGFDYEYAQAVSKKLGVPVEFIEIDWDNKVFELKDKKVDLIWNGMTITDELKKSMDMTEAYLKNAQVLVMAADKVADYKTAEDLKDLKFAVEAGSAGQKVANDNGYESIEVLQQSDALVEVKSGKVDACIIDLAMANAMTGEGTSYANLAKGIELSTEEFGIGCRQGSDLVAKINQATEELKADGTMKALAEKYNLVLAD